MYIIIMIAVLALETILVSSESTREPPKEIQQKTTYKTLVNNVSTLAYQANVSSLKSFLVNQPTTGPTRAAADEPKAWADTTNARYKMLLRAPHSLTKIAKTLSVGYDPYFKKDYFEPFERRPRPITLLAFRKNGFVTRDIVRYAKKSSEVAEMQSPYNEVGSFWQDD